MLGNMGYAPFGCGPKGASRRNGVRYTTRSLVQAFVDGAEHGHAGALHIDGGVLYSYAEPIAIKVTAAGPGSTLAYVTSDKFSRTTTHHTHMVAVALTRAGWTVEYRSNL